MALLQISEPNQSPDPHQGRLAVGIDLGTTHTLLAHTRDLMPKILPIDGAHLMPSVVHFGQDGILVGASALTVDDPANTLKSAKRFMGKTRADIRFSHPYTLGGGDDMVHFITHQGRISPVLVAMHLLTHLKQNALDALDAVHLDAVITVPAYFDEAQRGATLEAAKAAGIEVLRLINEPTAAALAYGLDKRLQDMTCLVFDLGGGTFDVSLLTLHEGALEVLATGGNSALGGDDIDRLLGKHLADLADVDFGTLSPNAREDLFLRAKALKEALGANESISVHLDTPYLTYHGSLTQEMMHRLLAPIIERCLLICQDVINQKDAKVDEVVLVGGSTRLLAVQDALQNAFNKAPLCSQNPDEVVALGAAILAQELSQQLGQTRLLDVTPLSLGVETMGDLTEVIIPRNTPIPAQRAQVFTTHKDNQTGLIVHVVQGERESASNCRSLGRFVLSGLPAAKAGSVRIEVVFHIDENGTLTVSATETRTQKQAQIDIIPSHGLSEEDQQALLQAGAHYAKADAQYRMRKERMLRATQELDALYAALDDFGYLLEDAQPLREAMARLETVKDGDFEEFKVAFDALKVHSDAFAALIMNHSIQESLGGTRALDW